MSNKNIAAILSKIESVTPPPRKEKKEFEKTDWTAWKAEKEKLFYKPKPGKNYLVMVPQNQDDPFLVWAYHNSLQEEAFWSVPCDAYNKDKECKVCNAIQRMKDEDEENGNRNNNPIYYPIRQQFEFYVPVVNVETEATIKEGVKWLKFKSSVMSTLKDWLANIEEDEELFYSQAAPQKIILTYNKGAAPSDQYKLDRKPTKPFDAQWLAEQLAALPPASNYFLSKSSEEMTKILDGYFERIENEVKVNPETKDKKSAAKKETKAPVQDDDDEEEDEDLETADTEVVDEIPAKLNFLKKGKK